MRYEASVSNISHFCGLNRQMWCGAMVCQHQDTILSYSVSLKDPVARIFFIAALGSSTRENSHLENFRVMLILVYSESGHKVCNFYLLIGDRPESGFDASKSF